MMYKWWFNAAFLITYLLILSFVLVIILLFPFYYKYYCRQNLLVGTDSDKKIQSDEECVERKYWFSRYIIFQGHDMEHVIVYYSISPMLIKIISALHLMKRQLYIIGCWMAYRNTLNIKFFIYLIIGFWAFL